MLCVICTGGAVDELKNFTHLSCLDCICDEIANNVLSRSISRLKKDKQFEELLKIEYQQILFKN